MITHNAFEKLNFSCPHLQSENHPNYLNSHKCDIKGVPRLMGQTLTGDKGHGKDIDFIAITGRKRFLGPVWTTHKNDRTPINIKYVYNP